MNDLIENIRSRRIIIMIIISTFILTLMLTSIMWIILFKIVLIFTIVEHYDFFIFLFSIIYIFK